MRLIKLTKGKYAMVDDEDFNFLSQWNWCTKISNKTFYARRVVKTKGVQRQVYLHLTIMDIPNNMECDHVDGNGLNCQKDNLRICTHKQNGFNKTARSKTGYKGVSYNGKYIRSVIEGPGGQVHLGYFNTEKEAAMAYNKATIKYHGEFANLNIIKS